MLHWIFQWFHLYPYLALFRNHWFKLAAWQSTVSRFNYFASSRGSSAITLGPSVHTPRPDIRRLSAKVYITHALQLMTWIELYHHNLRLKECQSIAEGHESKNAISGPCLCWQGDAAVWGFEHSRAGRYGCGLWLHAHQRHVSVWRWSSRLDCNHDKFSLSRVSALWLLLI